MQDRYGRSAYGQRGLREAIGRGGLSLCYHGLGESISWFPDSRRMHLQLGLACGELPYFRRFRWRFPVVYDQAVSALLEDLYDRGLDKPVLPCGDRRIWEGPAASGIRERKRRSFNRDGITGFQAMSLLVAGGGMRTGTGGGRHQLAR